ncbi:unnamed protein product, partial [Chrysoparadoxa australica]
LDAEAATLLEEVKSGKRSLSDLLGPLFGSERYTKYPQARPGSKDPPQASSDAAFLPKDEYNSRLYSHVFPSDYANPKPKEKYDLVVVGAGVGGLLSVIMAKGLGKKAALIERHAMGGDCLNVGCVPSKALIACAKRVHQMRNSEEFGVRLSGDVSVDFGAVMKRVRRTRADISVHDSVERYARDFCEDIFLGQATFTSPHTVSVGGQTISFDKAVIATGGSALIPSVPAGLKDSPFLTNANFFNLEELPPRMLVIGAGPIGLELSQAMARLGSKVTVISSGSQLLPKEDPDAAEVLRRSLFRDGIDLIMGSVVEKIESDPDASGQGLYKAPWNKYRAKISSMESLLECEAVLVAAGRTPNVFGMGLEAAGVEHDSSTGVVISDTFQTSAPHIYAVGDCCSPLKFTHSADWQARLAIRNMFLGHGGENSQLLVPYATYTDPEVAHVGMYPKQLDAQGTAYETYVRPLSEVDRCKCEGVDEGFVKITVRENSDEILGATVVGPNAGDMLSEITVCMQNGVGSAAIAGTMHPYPTTQEAIRQAAAQYNKNFRTPVVEKVVFSPQL